MSVRNNWASAGAFAVVVVGSVVALLVASDRVEARPESAVDGRIAFTYGESGDRHPAQLAVMDADGKHRHDLPGFDGVSGLSWSPGGRLIAVQSGRDIYTVNADGRRRFRRVVRNGSGPNWSPNGRSIAFERSGDIWVVDLTDHRQRRIVRHADSPRWAPDGRKLAFARDRGEWCGAQGSSCVRRSELWVLDVAAKKLRLLARNGALPNWSPDGRRIVFQKWRSLGSDFESVMYVTRVDSSAERRLFTGYAPAWSPSGQEIAFIGPDRRHHYADAVIRARLDGSHRRVLYGAQPYCGCALPDWSR